MLAVLAPVPASEIEWLLTRSDLPNLAARVGDGKVGAYRIEGADAALVMSVGISIDTGACALWIESLGGLVGWAPKKNAALIGAVFKDCAEIAQLSGCSEIRIEANNRTGLKRRLFKNYGFVPVSFEAATYMRKAV